jgi:hypothetical protein
MPDDTPAAGQNAQGHTSFARYMSPQLTQSRHSGFVIRPAWRCSENGIDNPCAKVPRLAARSSEKVPSEIRARSADDTRALLPHAGNCIGNMAFHFKRLGCGS